MKIKPCIFLICLTITGYLFAVRAMKPQINPATEQNLAEEKIKALNQFFEADGVPIFEEIGLLDEHKLSKDMWQATWDFIIDYTRFDNIKKLQILRCIEMVMNNNFDLKNQDTNYLQCMSDYEKEIKRGKFIDLDNEYKKFLRFINFSPVFFACLNDEINSLKIEYSKIEEQLKTDSNAAQKNISIGKQILIDLIKITQDKLKKITQSTTSK